METLTLGRQVEILHHLDYDVILNTAYPDQGRVKFLLNMVGNGIPPDWKPYVTYDDLDEYEDSPKNIYIDDMFNPKFLGKVRVNTSPERIKQTLEHYQGAGKKANYAFGSLLNEFHITGMVKDILQTPEARQIASRYGFHDIELVEPLIGLIERATGRKIVFYDFIDADTPGLTRSSNRINRLKELGFLGREAMGKDLIGLFKRNGIFPVEFGGELMSSTDPNSGKDKLYLIDIEGFFKDAKSKFANVPPGGLGMNLPENK